MAPHNTERKKIVKESSSSSSSSQATYAKRRSGLFKKARELATLCDAEVAVILFSSTGEVNQQCSGDLMALIRKFKNRPDRKTTPAGEPKKQECDVQVDVPSQEKQKHYLKKLQSLGKNLTGMDLGEMHVLEQKLNEALLSLKDRKEQILLEEIEQYRTQETQAMWEIENLNRQVECFRSFFKSAYPMPATISYTPGMASNAEPANHKDSDTTLCLGLPFSGGR